MTEFDYIIIGAGSAGCVLAHRLSSISNVSVCIIESGPADTNPLIHIPFGLSFLNHIKSINWNFETYAETHLNNRCLYWPRGKTLGGSSSINAMCYVRGNPKNYDDWAKQGCKGWDWFSVFPYFIKSENNCRGQSKYHGMSGPLSVSELRHINPLTLDFIEAGKHIGMFENPDFNGVSQEGIGLYQVTQKYGERCSTANGYLSDDVKTRPDLNIITNTFAKELVIEGNRAVGVLLEKKKKTEREKDLVTLRAKREVLLCAGAIGSPQLLLQSGIGARDKLTSVGIACKHELVGVGENLQDHLDTTLLFRQKKSTSYGLSVRRLLKDSIAPWQYHFKKHGMLTSNIAEGAAFLKSKNALDLPDIQVHFLPALLADHGRKKLWGHGYTIHLCHLYPKSRGSIALKRNGADIVPAIQANYLSHQDDLQPLINAFKWARKIASQRPLSDGAMENKPDINMSSDQEIEHYIRDNAETLYHPVGTCKMGTISDPYAVVDNQLKVKGMYQLRVIDASIMPTIVGGNTNAPTVMIAEKGADLIIDDYKKSG
ncbi:MAG: choline dehydrogenase [Pseudomonadota bacterium]